jgi:hypothetical protein
MTGYTEKMRDIAGRLLKECDVEMVIGFRKGTMPMMNEPCFVTKPEDVQSAGMGQQLRHQPGQLPDQPQGKDRHRRQRLRFS